MKVRFRQLIPAYVLLLSGQCAAFFPPALQQAIEQIFYEAPFERPKKESKRSKILTAMFSQIIKRGTYSETNCQVKFSSKETGLFPVKPDLQIPREFNVDTVNFKALGHYLSTFSPEARTVLYYYMSHKIKVFGSNRFYYPSETVSGLFYDSESKIICNCEFTGKKFSSAMNELFTEPPKDEPLKREKINFIFQRNFNTPNEVNESFVDAVFSLPLTGKPSKNPLLRKSRLEYYNSIFEESSDPLRIEALETIYSVESLIAKQDRRRSAHPEDPLRVLAHSVFDLDYSGRNRFSTPVTITVDILGKNSLRPNGVKVSHHLIARLKQSDLSAIYSPAEGRFEVSANTRDEIYHLYHHVFNDVKVRTAYMDHHFTSEELP